jgi:hypothetical protein
MIIQRLWRGFYTPDSIQCSTRGTGTILTKSTTRVYRKQLAFMINCNDDDVSKTSLHANATVHGLAEKYVVPELKKLCRDAYRKTANSMFLARAVDELIQHHKAVRRNERLCGLDGAVLPPGKANFRCLSRTRPFRG